MKCELEQKEMYVFCLGCLIAQLVNNYDEADKIMKGHARLIASHHPFYKNSPNETRLIVNNGRFFNNWARTQTADPREVIIGELVWDKLFFLDFQDAVADTGREFEVEIAGRDVHLTGHKTNKTR